MYLYKLLIFLFYTLILPFTLAECLHAHNVLRSLHVDTGPVAWSDALTHDAQLWAEHIASIGGLPHSNHKEQGENIYWFSATGSCADATLEWYVNKILSF